MLIVTDVVPEAAAARRQGRQMHLDYLAYPEDSWHRGGGLSVSRHAMAPVLAWQHLRRLGRCGWQVHRGPAGAAAQQQSWHTASASWLGDYDACRAAACPPLAIC